MALRVNPGEPCIRPATQDDLTAIHRCVEDAYTKYIDLLGKPPGPMLGDYAEVMRLHHVFVAVDESGIAGVLVLRQLHDDWLLDNVAVQPARQGAGIGRHLIHFAEKWARQRSAARLVLYTHVKMTENIQMYQRLGYTETGRKREHGYHRLYMEKRL